MEIPATFKRLVTIVFNQQHRKSPLQIHYLALSLDEHQQGQLRRLGIWIGDRKNCSAAFMM
jgi:hypothetical protein